MKFLILAIGAFLIALLIILIIFLTRKPKKNRQVKKHAEPQPDTSFDNFYEDEIDYKTEALGSSEAKSNIMNPDKRDKIDFGEIPMLDKNQKQDILDKVCNKVSTLDSTGIFPIGSPDSEVESTRIFTEPEKAQTYAVLEYVENGCTNEFEMKNNVINIGRDPKYCELIISADNYMGRNHAAIYFKNKRFFIVDMNSKNGTFVNGTRVDGYMEIDDGYKLKIAKTEMKFKRCI